MSQTLTGRAIGRILAGALAAYQYREITNYIQEGYSSDYDNVSEFEADILLLQGAGRSFDKKADEVAELRQELTAMGTALYNGTCDCTRSDFDDKAADLAVKQAYVDSVIDAATRVNDVINESTAAATTASTTTAANDNAQDESYGFPGELTPIHDTDEKTLEGIRDQTDEEIIASAGDESDGIKVRPDGTIIDGHHRIEVLKERGYTDEQIWDMVHPDNIIPKEEIGAWWE